MSHIFARHESQKTYGHARITCYSSRAIGLLFSHRHRFFDSRNVQKRATKSDTSGHCLLPAPCWSALRVPNTAATLYGAHVRESTSGNGSVSGRVPVTVIVVDIAVSKQEPVKRKEPGPEGQVSQLLDPVPVAVGGLLCH